MANANVQIYPQAFKSAHELAAEFDLATEYLAHRQDDLERFMTDLKWEVVGPFLLEANVYGNKVRHELKPGTLHAFPCWGELFFADSREEPVVFEHFQNFAAFVLARWW